MSSTNVESDMIFVKPTINNLIDTSDIRSSNDKFLTKTVKVYINKIHENFENRVVTKVDLGNVLTILLTILPNTIALLYFSNKKLDIILRILISLSSFLTLILIFKLKCTKQLNLSDHIVSASTTAIISCILNVFFKYISNNNKGLYSISTLYDTPIGIYMITSISYLISVYFVSILNYNQKRLCKNIQYIKVIITFMLAILLSLFQGAIILLPNEQLK